MFEDIKDYCSKCDTSQGMTKRESNERQSVITPPVEEELSSLFISISMYFGTTRTEHVSHSNDILNAERRSV